MNNIPIDTLEYIDGSLSSNKWRSDDIGGEEEQQQQQERQEKQGKEMLVLVLVLLLLVTSVRGGGVDAGAIDGAWDGACVLARKRD